ncbi:hypothetical protein K8I31_16300, partial [bacterium]|nr:hypothetical protein [bacterium]
LYTAPQILPQWWPGYRSLDVLMWDGGATAQINTRQQQALDDWVQMGGTLVLAAGSNWQELSTSGLRLYCPLNLTGSRVVEAGTTLDAPPGQVSPQMNRQMVIATGELVEDENSTIWLKAGDDPFLVERKWGAGRIVFCAGSLNERIFEAPDLQETFLRFITDAPAPINTQIVTKLDNYIDGFLRWNFQAELPSTTFIAMYLGLYIILVVPVNYLVFRRIGRLEWAWFTVPIWAIVFAVGVYYIGALRQQSSVSVNQISVIESRPNARTATAYSYCAIYSPVRKWYDIEFDHPAAFPVTPERQINNMGRPQNNMPREVLNVKYDEGKTSINNYLIHHWSQRVFKGMHTVSLGNGIEIKTRWENGQLKGSITNNTDKILEKASISVNNWFESWASITPGQTIDIEAFTRQRTPDMNQYNRFNQYGTNFQQFKNDPARMIREHLCDAYTASLLEYHEAQAIGVFTALVREPQLTFDINNETVEPTGNTLLAVIFPYEISGTGETTLRQNNWKIVQGLTRMRGNRIQKMNMGMPNNNQMIDIQPGQENTWALRCTTPIRGAKILRMNLKMNYDNIRRNIGRQNMTAGIDTEFELQLKDMATNKFYPLSQITDGNGDVLEPSRFLNVEMGAIQCKMKAPNNAMIYFQIPELGIEIHLEYPDGTARQFMGMEIVDPPKPLKEKFETEY